MNKIKNILINVFGDGFFGLERDQNTQQEITNGYREYQKKHKKPEPVSICYGVPPFPLQPSCSMINGSCASFSSGQHNVAIGHHGLISVSGGLTESCNDQFIESHYE